MTPVIHQLVVAKGQVDTNCYIVSCPATREAAVIDPGCFNDREVAAVADLAKQHSLRVLHIINTHGHIDHVAGDQALKKSFGAELLIHRDDAGSLASGTLNGAFMFGFPYQAAQADRLLEDGDVITVGDISLTVLHTPGHTPGGICLLCGDVVFSGDTLFAGSVGRTDLPGGDENALLRSIRTKLLVLPDRTIVRPGHGQRTTIGQERENNPFL